MNATAARNIRAIAKRISPNGSTLQTRTGYSLPKFQKKTGKLIRQVRPFRHYRWIGYRRVYQQLKAEYLQIPAAHRKNWVDALLYGFDA